MKEMVITTGQTTVDWSVVELEESKSRHTSNYHPTSKIGLDDDDGNEFEGFT